MYVCNRVESGNSGTRRHSRAREKQMIHGSNSNTNPSTTTTTTTTNNTPIIVTEH